MEKSSSPFGESWRVIANATTAMDDITETDEMDKLYEEAMQKAEQMIARFQADEEQDVKEALTRDMAMSIFKAKLANQGARGG